MSQIFEYSLQAVRQLLEGEFVIISLVLVNIGRNLEINLRRLFVEIAFESVFFLVFHIISLVEVEVVG